MSALEMPSPLPVNAKNFDLGYAQDVSPVGTAFNQTIERAPPRWTATYSTPPLGPERDHVLQAFLDQLDGAAGTFLGFDPRRPRPWTSRFDNSNVWENVPGTPSQCTAANHDDSQLLLDGMVTGFTLTAGDYISLKRGNAWYLHRVIDNPVANGSNLLNANVRPRPVSSIDPVDVRLVRPCAEMFIIGKYKKEDQVSDIGPKYSFSAMQYINLS